MAAKNKDADTGTSGGLERPRASAGSTSDTLTEHVVVNPHESTAVELLEKAAEMLEAHQGPRSCKFYRNLAAQVRQLAARL